MKHLPLFLTLLSLAGSTAAQTVLVPAWVEKDAPALKAKHPALNLITYKNAAEAKTHAAEAEGIIGTPDTDFLEAAPKLRWVHNFSAGVEEVVGLPGIKDGKVALTSLKIYQGPEIADHALALLLHLTRNMSLYGNAQKEGAWLKNSKEGMPLIELRGRTVLVIGLGGIGTQVAERAHAFGMKVLAVDEKDVPLMGAVEYVGKPDELLELLPKADVVISCVPHTAKSEKMMGSAEFGVMKQGSYFINVSRGKIADTAALVNVLKDGKLAGAGLDVVDPEPLPADHPLWKMPNVVITPHVAGVSDARQERQRVLVLDNLSRFASGRPLKNQVDVTKGY